MRPMLDRIRLTLREVLAKQKDEMGFNLAAFQFIGTQIREQSSKNYIDVDTWEDKQISTTATGVKRGFVNIAW